MDISKYCKELQSSNIEKVEKTFDIWKCDKSSDFTFLQFKNILCTFFNNGVLKLVKLISSILSHWRNIPWVVVIKDESKWDKSTLSIAPQFVSKKKSSKLVILG